MASALDRESIEHYAREGYIAREAVLTATEVEEARRVLADLVRQMHAAALARSPQVEIHTEHHDRRQNYHGVELRRGPFSVLFQAGVDPFALSPDEAELKIRKLGGFKDEHPVLNRLSRHPAVLAIVESLVGPGALLFQDMALIKPPFIGSAKPWHQDDAYFSYAPLDQVVGVWLALDTATAANGCMHVIPGGHLRGGLRHYHSTLDCEIVPGRIRPDEAVAIELAPGGALFFSGMLPHETPTNRSPDRRRALQFHYRGADTRKVEREEYDALFVEADGTPASCRAAVG